MSQLSNKFLQINENSYVAISEIVRIDKFRCTDEVIKGTIDCEFRGGNRYNYTNRSTNFICIYVKKYNATNELIGYIIGDKVDKYLYDNILKQLNCV